MSWRLAGMTARSYRSAVALLLAFSLVAAACTSNGDNDDDNVDGEASPPASPSWAPAAPVAMLLDGSDLDGSDLDGFEVQTEPVQVDDAELRSDLVLPCGVAAPAGFGTDGAATVELYNRDDDILVWHTVARQSSDQAELFLSEVRGAAENCDQPWGRQSSGDRYELRMVDGPQVTMRADGTWTYTIEWLAADGTVRWTTTVVHVRCHSDVARLAITHPPEPDGSVVVIDRLAERATAGLQRTETDGIRLCSNVVQRLRNAAAVPAVPADWRTSFEPLPFSRRPAVIDSLSQVRAIRWVEPPEETLSEFLDIDDDGDIDPADVTLLAVMWLAFPDALLRDAPEDIKAVLLAGRELFDATPVGACISAGVHLWVTSEGLAELDPLELLGCGASFVAKVGAQSVRSLKFADDTRWSRAVDDTADLITEDNVAAVETTYSSLRALTSGEVRRPFDEQCGFGFAAVGNEKIRFACLIAPVLADE